MLSFTHTGVNVSKDGENMLLTVLVMLIVFKSCCPSLRSIRDIGEIFLTRSVVWYNVQHLFKLNRFQNCQKWFTYSDSKQLYELVQTWPISIYPNLFSRIVRNTPAYSIIPLE